MDAQPLTIVQLFTAWQFYVAGLVVIAITTGVKKTIPVEAAKLHWVKGLLQLGNLVIGGSLGFIPGFLSGGELPERILIGVVAGFLSEWIYRAVRKRAPGIFGEMTGTTK